MEAEQHVEIVGAPEMILKNNLGRIHDVCTTCEACNMYLRSLCIHVKINNFMEDIKNVKC